MGLFYNAPEAMGPAAANPPHTAADEWDRQTDGHCTVK